MAFWYLNFGNGSGSQNGSTASNAASSLAQFTTGPASGDAILCAETPAYNTGLTATFSKQSINVTLSAGASALFKDVYMDGAWTGAANVTATADAVNKKQGSNAASMAVAAAFTTGQIAYFATGLLNLSSFQKLSFWIKTSIATAANTLRLDLCTDTIGAVASTSYTIPFALGANIWTLITTPDLGAFSAVIQSINLQALLDPGTNTIIIDDVVACAAGQSLNTSSLIGIGDGWWWSQKSLSGTTLILDNGVASLQGAGRGWWNLNGNHSGTFPLYAINPIQVTTAITGVSNTGVELSGGWDVATMTTQSASGYTFLDRMDGTTIGFAGNSPKIHSRMGYARCQTANGLLKLIDCHCTNTAQGGLMTPQVINGVVQPSALRVRSTGGNSVNANGLFTVGTAGNLFQDSVMISNDSVGWALSLGGPAVWGTTYNNCQAHNCGANGFGGSSTNTRLTNINPTAVDNTGVGIYVGDQNLVFTATATGNTTYGINQAGGNIYTCMTAGNTTAGIAYTGRCNIRNASCTDTTRFIGFQGTGNILYSTHEAGDTNANYVYNGTVTTALPNSATFFCVAATGAGTYSGSGLAWIGTFGTSALTSGLTATNPARFSIGRFYVESGKNATFSYRVAKSSSTSIFGNLRIFGGLTAGVGSPGNDIVTPTNPSAWATNPPSASDYTQYSISTGTLSESGVIEVWFEFYPIGSNSGVIMIDSATASQV